MVSEAGICSNALRMLGANPIVSLSDESTEARLCNGLYASTRDELISLHRWNFCIKRVALAQLLDPPAYDFTVQYQLPADCLGVIEIHPAYPYRVEGGRLLTNSSGVSLLYKARIENPDMYSPGFVSTLEAYLAAKLAYPLTRQLSLSSRKYDEYLTALQMARILDDHEDTPDVVTPTVLTSVRRGSY